MIKGLYTAASGMMNLLQANDNIANNMSNINTTGFKKGIALFQSFAPLLLEKVSSNPNERDAVGPKVGNLSAGSQMAACAIDFSQGPTNITNEQFDFAISGDAFFELQTANGQKLYTRDGRFELGTDGYLVTREGHKVMGKDDKPIKLTEDFTDLNESEDVIDFEVRSDGTVLLNNEPVNKIKLIEFDNKLALMRQGDNCFLDTGSAGAQISQKSSVLQGALEGSNANVIRTMCNSIEGMRTYETLARIVETTSKNLEKTTTQLGKV